MPSLDTTIEVFGTLAAVVVLAIAASLEPDLSGLGTHTQLGLSPCGYLLANGRPCLSCGLTTSFASLAHGQVALAWRANPAGFPLFLMTAAAPFWLIHAARTRKSPLRFVRHRFGGWLLPAILITLTATWIARTI